MKNYLKTVSLVRNILSMYDKPSYKFTFTFFLFALLPLGLSTWQAGAENLSAATIHKVRKISKIYKYLAF